MEKGPTGMSEPGYTIPHSVGCEKSVVSMLMKFPERLDDAPCLSEDHFYLPSTRLFFRHVAQQIRESTVDTTLLIQRMLDAGDLERAGGASTMSEIYTYAPFDGNFLAHVAELDRFLAYRKTIAAANAMQEAALAQEDASVILRATSEPLTAIQDLLTGAKSRTMTKGAVLDAALAEYQDRCEGKKKPMGIETSLPCLNRAIRGLNPQKTIVISAYPGGGKTTLATQLCLDASLTGAHALIISLEMPQVDIMNRALAYVSRQEFDAVIDPVGYAARAHSSGVTKGMLKSIEHATRKIKEANFEIEDMVGADVHQIGAVIRRISRRTRLDVVAVDYAQRIRPTPEKARESREQQLSHASNLLADLAKELGFCLLLPSQLNKQGAAKHAEAINEDADTHLRIIQDDEKNHVGVMVEKNRGGESQIMLPMVLNGPMIRFDEKEP